MHLKSYLKNKYIWILGLIALLLWRLASGYFSRAVEVFTESRVRNYAEELIATVVEDEILTQLDGIEIFKESYDSAGKVAYAYVDSLSINKIRNQVVQSTDLAISRINEHEDFGHIEIPLGYFFGIKYFLADGVRVPIRLEVIGNQDVEIKTDTISKGINTTIVEMYLEISVEVGVVIPFQSKITNTTTKIPLAMSIMNNEIPFFYTPQASEE